MQGKNNENRNRDLEPRALGQRRTPSTTAHPTGATANVRLLRSLRKNFSNLDKTWDLIALSALAAYSSYPSKGRTRAANGHSFSTASLSPMMGGAPKVGGAARVKERVQYCGDVSCLEGFNTAVSYFCAGALTDQ